MNDPEGDLMLRVRAGDPHAFEALVERFLGPLVGFFRRLGADSATAEDCAQDVFLKVYRGRAAYEPRARFSTFLFHVARNHWIDVYRHRAAGPQSVSSDARDEEGEGPLSDRLVSREREGSRGAQDHELAQALRAAVASLSPEHREVFALAQGEAFPYKDISEILGIPVGTVKSRMHAAVHHLQEFLRRRGIEP